MFKSNTSVLNSLSSEGHGCYFKPNPRVTNKMITLETCWQPQKEITGTYSNTYWYSLWHFALEHPVFLLLQHLQQSYNPTSSWNSQLRWWIKNRINPNQNNGSRIMLQNDSIKANAIKSRQFPVFRQQFQSKRGQIGKN